MKPVRLAMRHWKWGALAMLLALLSLQGGDRMGTAEAAGGGVDINHLVYGTPGVKETCDANPNWGDPNCTIHEGATFTVTVVEDTPAVNYGSASVRLDSTGPLVRIDRPGSQEWAWPGCFSPTESGGAGWYRTTCCSDQCNPEPPHYLQEIVNVDFRCHGIGLATITLVHGGVDGTAVGVPGTTYTEKPPNDTLFIECGHRFTFSDVNGDGSVAGTDFFLVLADFGCIYPPQSPACE